MKISVIVPLYYGKRYINIIEKMILESNFDKSDVELIFVNDCPNEYISPNEIVAEKFEVKLITNSQNMGIHAARIVGLSEAKGDYIIFLDQDDEVSLDCLRSQYNAITNTGADVVVGNGFIEDNNGRRNKIFCNKFSQWISIRERPFIMVRDFIVSPGQCIIRKASFPDYWIKNILKKNGTDDYYLWLLMFDSGAIFRINFETIYTHKNTGHNFSSNSGKMFDSLVDMLSLLRSSKYPFKKYTLLAKAIHFKANYKKTPFKFLLKNPIIFMYNVLHRIVWRGYHY